MGSEVTKTFTFEEKVTETEDLYAHNKCNTKIGIVQGGEICFLSVRGVDFCMERRYHDTIESEHIRITKNEREAKLYES